VLPGREWTVGGSMPEGGVLRGADLVNDELEVGFNSAFETRWHLYELAGRLVLAAVVAAGLAGFLGSGPFSHRRDRPKGGSITAIDFEPIARFGTPTQVTFHIKSGTGAVVPQGNSVELTLSTAFVEPFGLQGTQPAALQVSASRGDLKMTVLTQDTGEDALVRVTGKPSQVGPIWLTARIGNEAPVTFTQFVLP
jgi:hypothetical protein